MSVASSTFYCFSGLYFLLNEIILSLYSFVSTLDEIILIKKKV